MNTRQILQNIQTNHLSVIQELEKLDFLEFFPILEELSTYKLEALQQAAMVIIKERDLNK